MKRSTFIFAIVLVSLVGMVGVSHAQPAIQSILYKLQAIETRLSPKAYYLTASDEFKGDQALGACAQGFHMASLFEILDPTQLYYGYPTDPSQVFHLPDPSDQGNGPPTGVFGWVRTGYSSAHYPAPPGATNCSAWTEGINVGPAPSFTIYSGTTAAFAHYWSYYVDATPEYELLKASPWWDFVIEGCGEQQHVWCVQDPQ